ncbi:MAG: DnaD domain protein [Clostridia bacterium]|nr:DnaD domain protein [Clostridia bacterium]
MSIGKYSSDNPLNDVVLVEGDFINTFLLEMPPLFCKVYVYLLYLCAHKELKIYTPSAVSEHIGCSASELGEALEYLSKKHLINYTLVPFAFEILSASVAAKNTGLYNVDALTAYADYFAGIRALFPERSIKNSEYDKAKDWVEIYGFSVEAALMLIAHCISVKDKKISFSYIDSVALSWADEGVLTSEAAEEYISMYQAKTHDAAKILMHLGLKRTPTADEMNMYQKWTLAGFDLRAIKAACSETTKALNPSFAYLNRILENLDKLGIYSEKEIKAYLAESNSERRVASAILSQLGERSRTVTDVHLAELKALRDRGLKDDALILISSKVCSMGSHTFNKYLEKAKAIVDSGAITKEKINAYFEQLPKTNNTSNKNKNNFTGRSDGYGDSLYTDTDKLEV